MKYLIYILIGLVGIKVGQWLARKRAEKKATGGKYQEERRQKKNDSKEKVLKLAQEKKEITNNDVEKLLGIKDAMATRYLSELEKEDKLIQHGGTGRGVYYTLK